MHPYEEGLRAVRLYIKLGTCALPRSGARLASTSRCQEAAVRQ
jgi:hypothetical protein